MATLEKDDVLSMSIATRAFQKIPARYFRGRYFFHSLMAIGARVLRKLRIPSEVLATRSATLPIKSTLFGNAALHGAVPTWADRCVALSVRMRRLHRVGRILGRVLRSGGGRLLRPFFFESPFPPSSPGFFSKRSAHICS